MNHMAEPKYREQRNIVHLLEEEFLSLVDKRMQYRVAGTGGRSEICRSCMTPQMSQGLLETGREVSYIW